MWLKHKQGKIIYTLLRFPLLLKTHFWPCSYAYALIFIHRCSGSLFWLLGVPIGSLFQSLGVPISLGDSVIDIVDIVDIIHMVPEGRLYSSKSTNGGKGLKNSKINSYFTPW